MSEAHGPAPIERDLLLATLDMPTAERQAYLDQACEGRDDLKARIRQLLENAGETGSFMASPAIDLSATTPIDAIEVGTKIDRYKLMEQLGEGGMGVVYVAEQTEPVRRKVALKVIKPGLDSKAVIARFEAERQALAMMDHPNIARVLDAGTTGQRLPYFVMELVRGLPITQYCDQAKSTIDDRLRLFIDVCTAVQHAHQKGIIHRDLKPSNILVTLHDGKPVVKVIDFGLAKALHQQLTPHTLHTALHQVVGTPLYMSPEQFELSGLDIDTRTDVYSLGVLLHPLLCGTTPFDHERLFKSGFDEMRRIIREEDPPRPSYRVSTIPQQLLSTIAERRGLDNRELRRIVSNELDWITLKALEKDRQRRYASASEFAMDIRRYLENDPVDACPPSIRYRMSKYVRKHRWALATSTLVLIAMIMGTAVSVGYAVEAYRAKERAIASDRVARQAVDDMYTQFVQRWIKEQGAANAIQREFLQKASDYYASTSTADNPAMSPIDRLEARLRVAAIDEKLGSFDQAESALKSILKELNGETLQAEIGLRLVRLKVTMQLLTFCTSMSRDEQKKQHAEDAYHQLLTLQDAFENEQGMAIEVASIAARLSNALVQTGLRDEAEIVIQLSQRIWSDLLATEPNNGKYIFGMAASLQRQGIQRMWYGDRIEDAKSSFGEALKRYESIISIDPFNRAARKGLADTHLSLGVICGWESSFASAVEHGRIGIPVLKNLLEDAPADQLLLSSLATMQGNLIHDLNRCEDNEGADQVTHEYFVTAKKRVELFPSVPSYLDTYHSASHQMIRLMFRNGEITQAITIARDVLTAAEAAIKNNSSGDLGSIGRTANWARLELALVLLETKTPLAALEVLEGLDVSQYSFQSDLLGPKRTKDENLKFLLRHSYDEIQYLQLPVTIVRSAVSLAHAGTRTELTGTQSDFEQILDRIAIPVEAQVQLAFDAWLSGLEAYTRTNQELWEMYTFYAKKIESDILAVNQRFRDDTYRRMGREIFRVISEQVENGDTTGLSPAINELTNGEEGIRDPALALKLALLQIELSPKASMSRQDLAFAHFRNGNYEQCLELLGPSVKIGDPTVGGILAMALWHVGHKAEGARYLGGEYDQELTRYCQSQKQNEVEGKLGWPTRGQLLEVDREAKSLYGNQLAELLGAGMTPNEKIEPSTDLQVTTDSNSRIAIASRSASLISQANALVDNARDSAAIAVYTELIDTYPNDSETVDAFRRRGMAYKRLGKLEQANQDLSRALQLNPADEYTRAALLRVRCSLRKFDEAMQSVDEPSAADLNLKTRHFERALILAYMKRSQESLAAIQTGLELKELPFDLSFPQCDVFALRGVIHLRGLNMAGQAVADFSVALESDPQSSYEHSKPKLLRLRAEAYRRLGKTGQADEDEQAAQRTEAKPVVEKR